MNKELLNAIAYLSKEKGVSSDVICDSLEAVLITAYKKEPDANPTAEVTLNRTTGDYQIQAAKTVVDDVEDENIEISLDKARLIDPGYEVGDIVNVDVTPANFGRIAAQAAKQVMIQRLREAERNIVYDEFSDRMDDIITGIIQRIEIRASMSISGKPKRSCRRRNRFRPKPTPSASASNATSSKYVRRRKAPRSSYPGPIRACSNASLNWKYRKSMKVSSN